MLILGSMKGGKAMEKEEILKKYREICYKHYEYEHLKLLLDIKLLLIQLLEKH